MFLKIVYERLLRERVNAINRELDRIIASEVPAALLPCVRDAVKNGRRFRPLLVTVAGECGNRGWRDLIPLAAAVEFVHKASILHDDFVDGDVARRGNATFWREAGAQQAVVIGDLLLGISFEATREWDARNCIGSGPRMVDILVRAYGEMALGEFLDVGYERCADVSPEEAELMICLKSGSLVEASIRIGALAGGADPVVVEALSKYGRLLGTAFQMINDINNVNGIDRASKGEYGQDLRRGKKTLATLGLLRSGIDADRLPLVAPAMLIDSLVPAKKRLDEVLIATRAALADVPDGTTKGVFARLVDHAENPWFWTDADR